MMCLSQSIDNQTVLNRPLSPTEHVLGHLKYLQLKRQFVILQDTESDSIEDDSVNWLNQISSCPDEF